ncbi:MAG TPA: hypothetical protein VHV57_07120 [Acidimicrobiales bacterium]|jgi:hypothetical protein|nr:hypothetical protein [Acidimicrobiales bacterium]
MSIGDETQGAASFDRRKFLKRVALVTAFAAPVISTFTMDGVGSLLSQPQGNGANSSGDGANNGRGDNNDTPYFGNAGHDRRRRGNQGGPQII